MHKIGNKWVTKTYVHIKHVVLSTLMVQHSHIHQKLLANICVKLKQKSMHFMLQSKNLTRLDITRDK